MPANPASCERLRAAIRDVADFPQPGIVFKDITPVLADPALLRLSAELLTESCQRHAGSIDKVVGLDARGFIFGAMVAEKLGAGFVPVRKAGKLPWQTHQSRYELEYGEATMEIHRDAVSPGETVVVVDDLLATGGTAGAALELLEQLGVKPACLAFLIELSFLKGRARLGEIPVEGVLGY